jgi:sugar/nucleoside kinase (ribokinase family)
MHDFVAIGDIVVDAFIRLKEASVHCDVDNEHCTISMSFGDKIPYESVEVIHAVGNAPNAAVAAAHLGLKSALVTNLGDDEHGRKCLRSLMKDSVSNDFVTIHKEVKTNYHYVLWYDNDRTILVKHEEYKYKLPDIGSPKWVYLSSLGAGTLEYHKEIGDYIRSHREVKLAFQPGTFQMHLGKDELKDIYENSAIFFCNVEEAERILDVNTLEIQELLKRMQSLGPKTIVVTDGPKGAYAYDGSQMLFVPPYPEQEPAYERTGAGDSFASTTVAALALGNELKDALLWGSANSMSVVQEVGAQRGLLSREKIYEYLAQAGEDFRVKEL